MGTTAWQMFTDTSLELTRRNRWLKSRILRFWRFDAQKSRLKRCFEKLPPDSLDKKGSSSNMS